MSTSPESELFDDGDELCHDWHLDDLPPAREEGMWAYWDRLTATECPYAMLPEPAHVLGEIVQPRAEWLAGWRQAQEFDAEVDRKAAEEDKPKSADKPLDEYKKKLTGEKTWDDYAYSPPRENP